MMAIFYIVITLLSVHTWVPRTSSGPLTWYFCRRHCRGPRPAVGARVRRRRNRCAWASSPESPPTSSSARLRPSRSARVPQTGPSARMHEGLPRDQPPPLPEGLLRGRRSARSSGFV